MMLKDLETNKPEKCAGCTQQITERYYLLAADNAWHVQCLKCRVCSQNLDSELSCFARDGNIYCKEDYYRIFSVRRCARCGSGIGATDFVMRARDLIFHVNCFCCALCGAHLNTGDTAGIRAGRVFCCEHYDADLPISTTPMHHQTPFFTASTQQKGRPRKRKPLPVQHGQTDDNIIITTPGSHDHLSHEGALRLEMLNSDLTSSGSLDLSSYDGSQSPRSGGAMTPTSRNKRMRTSFKHHQLRTMKSYFAINQNPDAKDLKQLAQKTGLSKRVLQVWFQNARAKWRRNVMRQDGPQHPNGLNPTHLTSSLGQPGMHTPTSSNGSDSHALEEMHNMTFGELY